MLEPPPLRPATHTPLHLWDYDRPQNSLCRDQTEVTEAAAGFAAEAAWDGTQAGACAREIRYGHPPPQRLRRVKPDLRVDPRVTGWGICLKHRG